MNLYHIVDILYYFLLSFLSDDIIVRYLTKWQRDSAFMFIAVDKHPNFPALPVANNYLSDAVIDFISTFGSKECCVLFQRIKIR